MNRNVLVTGGAGYIGSHACKALLKEDFTPIVIDNLATGWRDAVRFGPLEFGSITDNSFVDEVFERYKPVAVMHFAGLSQVGESVVKPEIYWETNVTGSLNLINSAVKHNCLKLVFSSTCATYGDQDGVLLDENSHQVPRNAYGASKLAVENMLKDFEFAYGLQSVVFRYFNVAGADPDAEVGEFHRPETHLIPLIFDAIDGKRDSLTIFGTDYDTVDGTCIRDYVHVCDLVDAHILGLKWLLCKKRSRVFNLGSGKGFSVRQVIEQASLVTNKKVPITEDHRRPGDCASLVSGSLRALEELEWSSHRSNLRQMITDAWRWHQNGRYYN